MRHGSRMGLTGGFRSLQVFTGCETEVRNQVGLMHHGGLSATAIEQRWAPDSEIPQIAKDHDRIYMAAVGHDGGTASSHMA